MNITIAHIAQSIDSHNNFIITAHHNPDGDAMGAMGAMGYILQHLNKNFILYNISGVPTYLEQIPLPSSLYTDLRSLPNHFIPESCIVLDVSDPKRVGKELYTQLSSLYTINIDHHGSCPAFANINFIDPSYSATGCIIAQLAQHYCIPLVGNLAECLYLSITDDTGNFRNTNTNEQSLRLASIIVGNGLQVSDFIHTYQNQWSLSKMKLWGYLLSSFVQYYDHRVLICKIPLSLLQEYNCIPEDIDGINSFLMHINKAMITISLREVDESTYHGVKASLRSYNINLLPLVHHLGGGGHKNAAGVFFRDCSLIEAESLLCKGIQELGLIE